MGNKEEAEWILERLTTTLNRELEGMRRDELEREGGDEENDMTKHMAKQSDGASKDTSHVVKGETVNGKENTRP